MLVRAFTVASPQAGLLLHVLPILLRAPALRLYIPHFRESSDKVSALIRASLARIARKLMRKSVLLLTVVTMLAACGLKGPLYLPEKKPVAAAPAAVPAPDAQAGTKKNPESK